MAVRLDEMDRKILAELQIDSAQSLDEIARKVGSSKTPVWNRIRRMKEAGVITRQTAILDAEALGLEACFFVLIRTSEHEAEWQRKFLKTLKERPEVLEEMARVSRGRVVQPAQLGDLIKEINALPEPRPLESRIPLWSHWATLAALIALLGIFWTGRKLNGTF